MLFPELKPLLQAIEEASYLNTLYGNGVMRLHQAIEDARKTELTDNQIGDAITAGHERAMPEVAKRAARVVERTLSRRKVAARPHGARVHMR